MIERYPVLLADQQIGEAHIHRQGLYWNIQCRCQLTGQVIYKVLMSCTDKVADLGVLVSGQTGFEINTCIPIKRIGTGPFSFRAVPRHQRSTERFVPVYPEEPFRYLEQLKTTYLQVREGRLGVILPQAEDPQGSDQNQLCHDKSARL